MMRLPSKLGLLLALLASSTGCMATGHVAQYADDIGRARGERLTATCSTMGPSGALVDVTALEAECRVVPVDPEGGPSGVACILPRVKTLNAEENRIAASHGLLVAAYRAGPEAGRAMPEGLPESVVLVEDESRPAVFLRIPGGWTRRPCDRYLHTPAKEAHPVLAGFVRVALVPPALALDLATFPVQWMLLPWFPIMPEW